MKYKFSYKDTSLAKYDGNTYVSPVILEVIATTLTEADETLKKEKKLDPIKNKNISVAFILLDVKIGEK